MSYFLAKIIINFANADQSKIKQGLVVLNLFILQDGSDIFTSVRWRTVIIKKN